MVVQSDESEYSIAQDLCNSRKNTTEQDDTRDVDQAKMKVLWSVKWRISYCDILLRSIVVP